MKLVDAAETLAQLGNPTRLEVVRYLPSDLQIPVQDTLLLQQLQLQIQILLQVVVIISTMI